MKSFIALLLISLSIITCGCIFSNDNNENTKKSFTFPLKVGNRWEYSGELKFFNFNPDTMAVAFGDTLHKSTIIQEIVRTETLLDSIDTYVFHETHTYENYGVFETNAYYHEKETGLYRVAYDRGSKLSLKPAVKEKIYFKGRCFSSVSEITAWIQDMLPRAKTVSDSLIYEYFTRQSLKYPLEEGSQWVYHNSNWRIDKRVEGKEKVIVPAGTFTCYKIRWLYDFDGDEEWDDDIGMTDYICSKGLVRRYLLIEGIEQSTDSYVNVSAAGSDSLYTFDCSEEYLLTDYSIH